MASEHDLDLVTRIGAGDATGVLVADDPAGVAGSAAGLDGTVPVAVEDLAAAIAAARVRLGELVVARARRAEGALLASVTGTAAGADTGVHDDVHAADRQAVRFALVILVLALAGGIAVYAVDGLVLAPALPAAALVGLGGVVLVHRRPSPVDARAVPVPRSAEPVVLGDGPAVRAAEAHLRRQQAAWKLVWWERDEPVPDLATWLPLDAAPPVTLVSVDPSGRLDGAAHATMTATVPAAVRVVVLRAAG